MTKQEQKENGFVNRPVPEGTNVKAEIHQMCREENTIIIVHYYTRSDVQDIADLVGDSLALAQKAVTADTEIIVMCGVHFMGETNKILCPDKKVLVPDLNASCSLAGSCPAGEFKQFAEIHPDYTVISYVNATAATKAVTDVVVTSSNARQIVKSFPRSTLIIFGPDENLGGYINNLTSHNMLLWKGACHVHEKFSMERILQLKAEHPGTKILTHPEHRGPVVKLTDKVDSTAAPLKYSTTDGAKEFIATTKSGILHEMQKSAPQKTLIPAPPNGSICAYNEYNYMKLVNMHKLYNYLKYERPIIEVPADVTQKAIRPINHMLEMSRKLGL